MFQLGKIIHTKRKNVRNKEDDLLHDAVNQMAFNENPSSHAQNCFMQI